MAPQFSGPSSGAAAAPGARGDAGRHHESDEFRMYSFKIKRCCKTRSHDWTECPYAHRGEKARRRDPRKFLYHGIACPEFQRAGDCSRGQLCEFAHGVFEFWLHPSRYRTRACKAGAQCQRKVCFFAHTAEQLRAEGFRECRLASWHGGGSEAAAVGGGHMTEPPPSPSPLASLQGDRIDISECMRRLEIGGDAQKKGGFGVGETSDFPDIDWICELVK